jgi:hypothetical protein
MSIMWSAPPQVSPPELVPTANAKPAVVSMTMLCTLATRS